ncbi:zinc finger protein ZAT9-like [Vicia villosa]|uniref:zinc finger protein ZAT9-like n=1 Tax=Vicia villosa TaxID=3911 RepID=UPI00273B076D|nr:zinc finger protein ZAT9-like [Vicia villosa]
MEEKKFECRYCLRKFLCGKSLGGHIRTHMMSENEERRIMNANAAAANTVFKFDDGRKRKRSELGSSSVGGDDGNYIYGLRENPKKTTRFVHSNAAAATTVQNERFCKDCGKGFFSLKALCGHMASHSEKGVVSGVGVRDSQSDTEDSVPTDTRKSKRMKLKIISNENRPSSSSPPWGNCSSSISEVDQDHEEVARTLMMLSRDYSFKGRFALRTDSSENNSAVVEPEAKLKLKLKSKMVDTKVVGTGMIKVNGMTMKYYGEGYDSDNSDSGYFLHGPKKVESDDASSEWCLRNRFQDHDFASSKKIQSNKNNGYGNDEMYSGLKNVRESYSDESVYESDENSTDSDSYTAPKAQANKSNMNGAKSGNYKKSSSKGKKKVKSKKNKEHDCPLCPRTFKSGQALGGHKRSHFVGGGYDESTLVIRPGAQALAPARALAPVRAPAPAPAAVNACLIDLNLPAPDDE